MSVALSGDGWRAVSGSGDESVRVWDLKMRTCVATLTGHGGWVKSVALSRDGRRAVSGSNNDEGVRVWDLDTCIMLCHYGEHLHLSNLSIEELDRQQTVSAHSSDKTYVAFADLKYRIHIWGHQKKTFVSTPHDHSDIISVLHFTSDNHYILSGSRDTSVRLWSISSMTCIASFQTHSSPISHLTFSTDGQKLNVQDINERHFTWRNNTHPTNETPHPDPFSLSTLIRVNGSWPLTCENLNIYHAQGLSDDNRRLLIQNQAVENEHFNGPVNFNPHQNTIPDPDNTTHTAHDTRCAIM